MKTSICFFVVISVFSCSTVNAQTQVDQQRRQSAKIAYLDQDSERPRLESASNQDNQDRQLPGQNDQSPSSQLDELRSQTLANWPAKSLSQIGLEIRETGVRVPRDRSSQLRTRGVHQVAATSKVFAWAASDIRYQPLYFEDVALERYGQTFRPLRQSIASGAHFFKSFTLLPHQMRYDGIYTCDSPLGFCRPGNPTCDIQQHQFYGWK